MPDEWPADVASTLNAAFGDKQGLEDQHALSGASLFVPDRVSATVTSKWAKGSGGFGGDEHHNLVVAPAANAITANEGQVRNEAVYGNQLVMTLAVRGRQGEADLEWREDGTSNAVLTPSGGRAGIGVGAIAFGKGVSTTGHQGDTFVGEGDIHPSLTTWGGNNGGGPGALVCINEPMAFGWQNSDSQGISASQEVVPTLDKSKTPAVVYADDLFSYAAKPSKGYDLRNRKEDDVAMTLQAGVDKHSVAHVVQEWAVRRLTPVECERLQGFPDNWTSVTHNGKEASDGPRYRALGNSMAVNVMRWLGRRIEAVEGLG